MPLRPGTRLGLYEITAQIGVGGMGEVYQAKDTRLKRDVALKVIPDAFAADPERVARFEREAELLATLNHPNIAGIYGLEESSGVRALVLELVEGPTLADRLATGAIRIIDALPVAAQIALALEAAHEKGIVHRDLKPSNIKVRPDGTVKVLDFGLAKAASGDTPGPDQTQAPTVTAGWTREGVIVGTAAYMSPEQATGQPVDRRTDIWAFGCVLFEMLTGARAFARETLSDVLVAVQRAEPDWRTLPAETPASIRTLLRRCLEKDRKRRLDSAAAARLEIDDALAFPVEDAIGAGVARSRHIPRAAIAALATGALLASLITWVSMRREAPNPVPTSRFPIVPSSAQPLNVSGLDRNLALSPDGRYLVYRAGGSLLGGSPLMLRATDRLDAQQLAGVGGAYGPFFSPDSQWIGFFAGAELMKVSIAGGAVLSLCQVNGTSLGASWSADGTIVFATSDRTTGLWRVSAQGGEPTVLTRPDPAHQEGDHWFPSILPGGRGVLFTISAPGQMNDAQVAVLDLKTGQRKILIRGASDAEYVKTGHLIYAAAGALRAVRFDLERLEVLSDPVPVVDAVMMTPNGAANYAVSQQGTLVYVPGGAYAVTTSPRSLVWVDRKGREEPIRAPLRPYGVPRLSPDGARVAVELEDQENDVWIWDFSREALTRLTFDAGFDVMPVWTPDSRRVIFASTRAGVPNLYGQAADGTGPIDRLATSGHSQMATSITPDGQTVIGFESWPKAQRVFVLPLAGPSGGAGHSPNVKPAAQALFDGFIPEVSPDGRYIAYQLYEVVSGRNEVYVRPFPHANDGRWQVSAGGGTRPAWARSGRELFYLDASQKLTAVPVDTSGSTFRAGSPLKLFDTSYANPFPARWYDVSPDGQRFLMIKDRAAADQSAPPSMTVVLNWFEELKRLVPTK